MTRPYTSKPLRQNNLDPWTGSRVMFDRPGSDSWLFVEADGDGIRIDSCNMDGVPRLERGQVKNLIQCLEEAIS